MIDYRMDPDKLADQVLCTLDFEDEAAYSRFEKILDKFVRTETPFRVDLFTFEDIQDRDTDELSLERVQYYKKWFKGASWKFDNAMEDCIDELSRGFGTSEW